MPREAASHNLTESTLHTLAFYLVKIRPLGGELRPPSAAPSGKTTPSSPMASTAKCMPVTQTKEGSGPVRKENRELTCVSTPSQVSSERHRGGARVPQQGSQWGKKPERKFKVLRLLTAIYGNVKTGVRNESLGRQDKD